MINNIDGEEWRDIKGYEGLYQISNKGRVKCLSRTVAFGNQKRYIDEHFVKIFYNDHKGVKTPHCYLKKQGKQHTIYTPIVVYETFVGKIPKFFSVYSIDGSTDNCSVENIGIREGYKLWTKKFTNNNVVIKKRHIYDVYKDALDDELIKQIRNKKFVSVSDIAKKDRTLYNFIKNYKKYLFDEIFGKIRHSVCKRCIYSYHFILNDVDYIYVGLTYNHKHRDYQHRTEDDSAVYQFAADNNIEIPEMKIEVDYTDANLAARLEGETLEYYISKGYIPLNKVKTGGLSAMKKRHKNCLKNYDLLQ